MCDNREAPDPSALESAQEDVVVFERHAAVEIAVRPQHVGMRQQSNAIEREPRPDRVQAQSLHAMKEQFAQRELIDAWWSRAMIALVHETGVVDPIAKARMGLQTHAVRQINGVRRYVVDRGRLVVTCRGAAGRRRSKGPRGRQRRDSDWRSDFGRRRLQVDEGGRIARRRELEAVLRRRTDLDRRRLQT